MSNNLFICENCGGVTPDQCDQCEPKGVTVQHIKDCLDGCATNPDVTACRQRFGRHIATLKRSTTEGASVMAIQIENLVLHKRRLIFATYDD